MGIETAIALGLTAAGTAAKAKAARDASKAQERSAAGGVQMTAEQQRMADQRVMQELGRLSQSGPAGAQRAATGDFLASLRNAPGRISAPVGKVSRAFTTAAGNAGRQLQTGGRQQAQLAGALAAPARQRETEQAGLNRLGNDLSGIGRNISGNAYVNQLRTAGIQQNPLLAGLGGIASGIGGGMLGRMPTGGAGGGLSASDVFNRSIASSNFGK